MCVVNYDWGHLNIAELQNEADLVSKYISRIYGMFPVPFFFFTKQKYKEVIRYLK